MTNIVENIGDLKEFFLEFVNHYSPSGSEMEVSKWLVEKMLEFGFDRSFSDEVYNAIGEIGPENAPNHIVCLGHIDTVNGELPVKFVDDDGIFWGRGSVDAKGPFSNFILSALKAKAELEEYNSKVFIEEQYKIIIIGAVEEEITTSKGAHHVSTNGFLEKDKLRAIVIGEPSDYRKMTIGYKGRWVCEVKVDAPRTHTAHGNMGAAEMLIYIYNKLNDRVNEFNKDKGVFDSFQLHIRSIETQNDNVQDEDSDIGVMKLALRGGPDFDVKEYEEVLQNAIDEVKALAITHAVEPQFVEEKLKITLYTKVFDPTVVSPKNTILVKAFLRSMREYDIQPRFSYKTGTSDMNVLGAYFSEVPILTYGPGDSKLDHTEEEHLYLDHLLRSSEVLSKVFIELLPNFSTGN
ncbi:MAG: M20/M25/M40 family metallo-hydrolase [Candidatus Peregrinibacteria bacterium]|nr:M20/M25/M40 family metallo-hydrolase [Candidatus Peregrinibacteria bacterium]MDZ4244523.1 M20/M25/M40 family metallo-hydrolase [Candidatus Gracilibacteria bacterium]